MSDEFLALRCNFPLSGGGTCNKVLEGDSWATSCSHLFCDEHAKEWFETDNRCPLCLDKEGRVKMAKIRMSRDSSAVKELLGLSPVEVHSATAGAITFWMEQKFAEFKRKLASQQDLLATHKKLVGNGRKRLSEADALKSTLKAGSDELKRQLREEERRLAKKQDEVSSLKARLADVQRRIKDAQGRAAGINISSHTHRGEESFTLRRTPPQRLGCSSRSPRRTLGSARSKASGMDRRGPSPRLYM